MTSAKAWAKEIEDDLVAGRLKDRIEAERHTLAEAIDYYLEHHLRQDLKPGGSQKYRRQHLVWWRYLPQP